ncbi:hypothetical protein O6H91_21G069000 [Diphasiastrum complanatum]|uniref:Uncharacterized protein n=1 Tax=Diphasiastrum complanatum TaxID=34168 RepID=A0ACC2ALN8_DIPCM|nr:hypothetical protein O6H91_21G069000 [Diphasiastrum complanatum]
MLVGFLCRLNTRIGIGSRQDHLGAKAKTLQAYLFGSSAVEKAYFGVPLRRGKKVISLEAEQVVTALKRVKDQSVHTSSVLETKVKRLLKSDVLSVLYTLQHQNEADLALKVFKMIQKEFWYVPDVIFYRSMIAALGRSEKFDEIDKLLIDLQSEGLKPTKIVFLEILQNCLKLQKFSLVKSYLEKMKQLDCPPDEQILRTCINSLQRVGEAELSSELETQYLMLRESRKLRGAVEVE